MAVTCIKMLPLAPRLRTELLLTAKKPDWSALNVTDKWAPAVQMSPAGYFPDVCLILIHGFAKCSMWRVRFQSRSMCAAAAMHLQTLSTLATKVFCTAVGSPKQLQSSKPDSFRANFWQSRRKEQHREAEKGTRWVERGTIQRTGRGLK